MDVYVRHDVLAQRTRLVLVQITALLACRSTQYSLKFMCIWLESESDVQAADIIDTCCRARCRVQRHSRGLLLGQQPGMEHKQVQSPQSQG